MPDEYHVNAAPVQHLYARPLDASDKLTIDFGTRWEYFPVPTRPDRGSNSTTSTPETSSSAVSAPYQRTAGSTSSKARFGPRVGLAYRLATNGSRAPDMA